MFRILFAAFFAAACAVVAAAGLAAEDAPRIAVTIKPVHSLAGALMRGAGEPLLLIDGAQSPHRYHLKPSTARALAEAALIVQVGARLEGGLNRAVDSLGRRVLTLADALPSDTTLPLSGDHSHDEHHDEPHDEHDEHHDAHEDEHHDAHDEHHDAHEDEHHDEHDEDQVELIDPHFWLSPRIAQAIAELIAEELIALDPANADLYRANLRALRDKLLGLDADLRARLRKAQAKPYLVLHDAYRYFQREYRLRPAMAVTGVSAAPLAGARLRDLRAEVRKQNIRCLFAEPQLNDRRLRALAADLGDDVAVAVLDPLGANIPAGEDAYFQMMRALADNLAGCLENQPEN